MATNNPGTTNLEAYWKLDEASGVRYSSHGDPGVFDLSEMMAQINSRDGKWVKAPDFTAADLLGVTDPPTMQSNTWTFGCWFYMDAENADMTIAGKWDEGLSDREWRIFFDNPADNLIFQVSNNGTAITNSYTWGVVHSGSWYFVIVYFNTASAGIIVNNTGLVSGACLGVRDGTAIFSLGGNMNLGATPVNLLDGAVDEAFFYNRVLSANERTWLWNNGYGRSYQDLINKDPENYQILREAWHWKRNRRIRHAGRERTLRELYLPPQ